MSSRFWRGRSQEVCWLAAASAPFPAVRSCSIRADSGARRDASSAGSGGGALSEARSGRLGKGVRSWASGSSVTASQTVISPSASHGGVISAQAQGWFRVGAGWAVRWAAHENQVRLKLQEKPSLGVAIPTGLRSRHAGTSYAPKNGCTGGWSSGARPC